MLFLGAIVVGVLCLLHSMTLGDLLPAALRWPLRATLALCAFLGAWGVSSYTCWELGLDLKIGSVANGRIREVWWSGPAACVFAMTSYGMLR